MTKSIYVAAVAALVTATAADAKTNFSGGYVGGNIGYAFGKTKVDSKGAADWAAIPGDSKATFNSSHSSKGVTGGLHLGYGAFVSKDIYMGLEGFGSFDSVDMGTKVQAVVTAGNPNDAISTSSKKKNSLGIAARMGTQVGQGLLYGTVGYVSSKFDNAAVASTDDNKNPEVDNLGLGSVSQSKRLNGLMLGAGYEMDIAKNVRAGIQYKYTTYSRHNMVLNSTPVVDKPEIKGNSTISVKPSDHTVALRVSYAF